MYATQQNYIDLVEMVVWHDLKAYMIECIEMNRDLLEGRLTQKEESKETEEALRGRNRQLRELIHYVEGVADGSLPMLKNQTEE